jgi:polysaccharide export outer membrane protein
MRTPLIVLLFCAVAAVLTAQSPPGAAIPEVNSANLPANLPAQKIGVDDLVSVSVYGSPELSRTLRVGADGTVRLPMLKARVQALGLMPGQLETALADAIRREQILVEPVVTVAIVEYRSRPISVAGSVRRPITFQAFSTVTLLDAITRAEGLSPEAGPEILVSKLQKGPDGEPTTLVQRIPVKGLIDAADPDLNLRLTGGEDIRVPDAGRIYIVGNVKKPGVFPIHDTTDSSILKLLALSEGLLPYASDQAYIYRREGTSGSKNEIPIDLKKIVDRKAPDVTLIANDILYVPEKRGKKVAFSTLEKLLTFGSASGAALVYAGVK